MSLKIARKVLLHEAAAIRRMAGRLDRSFKLAVDTIYRSKGPVIVVGMGKPFFIGEKISASLASTGTPSFSLHPADALHGDLGRIPPRSVVLLLSNSGQTEEMVRLLPLLRSRGAKLIAITGNPASVLARHADVPLDASVISEAQPLSVVPTASTTCMLAMGDALTMALVRKRGFKEDDFALLHPGGMLGKQLRLTVKDVMRKGRQNPCVSPAASVRATLIRITESRAGSATVVDARRRCLGIFTDGDLRRNFRALTRNPGQRIDAFMTKKPLTVREKTLAVKALELFKKKRVDELPVVNERGRVTGLLDVQDLLAQGFVLPGS